MWEFSVSTGGKVRVAFVEQSRIVFECNNLIDISVDREHRDSGLGQRCEAINGIIL